MNTHSNDKLNDKILTLTTANAKLTKENELMRANLSDIYSEIKEILVKGEILPDEDHNFERLIDEIENLVEIYHTVMKEKTSGGQ